MLDELDINWEDEFNNHPNDIEKRWDFFMNKSCEAQARCVPRNIVKINGNYSTKNYQFRSARKNSENWKKISFGPKCAKMDSDGDELAYHKFRNQIKRLTRQGNNNGEKDCETNTKQPQFLLEIWAVETKHSGRYPRSRN